MIFNWNISVLPSFFFFLFVFVTILCSEFFPTKLTRRNESEILHQRLCLSDASEVFFFFDVKMLMNSICNCKLIFALLFFYIFFMPFNSLLHFLLSVTFSSSRPFEFFFYENNEKITQKLIKSLVEFLLCPQSSAAAVLRNYFYAIIAFINLLTEEALKIHCQRYLSKNHFQHKGSEEKLDKFTKNCQRKLGFLLILINFTSFLRIKWDDEIRGECKVEEFFVMNLW